MKYNKKIDNGSLVSVIMPAFNAEKYIGDSINSVILQSYQKWELLIVNDGSTDNTKNIIKPFILKDKRINYFETDNNLGPGYARNKAIEKAKGHYIAFLDSDDMWKPEKLEVQLNFMKKNNSSFSFTGYQKINESNQNIGKKIEIPNTLSYENLLKSCIIGCLTVIYDVSKLGKVYMPLINKTQDYAMWLNILKIIPYAHGLNESLALYRIRKGSISSNKFIKAYYQWHIYRKFEKLSLMKSLKYMLFYAYYGYRKFKL